MHIVEVFIDLPIRLVIHQLDALFWIANWAIELGEFDIKYLPKPSIKDQMLVDFILKCTILEELELHTTKPMVDLRAKDNKECWALHVNGSLNNVGQE